MTKKTNTCPVIAYPEGVIVGKVQSGKNRTGTLRHIAFNWLGNRVGTYDTYARAMHAIINEFRNES